MCRSIHNTRMSVSWLLLLPMPLVDLVVVVRRRYFFSSFFSFSCVCLSDEFGASFLPLSRCVASLVITFAIVASTTFVADSFFQSLCCLIHSCASNTTTSLLDWLFIRFVLNCRRITLDRYDLLLCCRLTIVSIIPYAKWCGCHFSRSHHIAVSLSKNDDIIYEFYFEL